MKTTVTRILEFDAGHRLLNHESKCRHLHGHRYKALVTCSAKKLDGVGRVIDFSVIKEVVGEWIDENWDHNVILHRMDLLLEIDNLHTRTPFIMDGNPTAENMAELLFRVAENALSIYHVKVEKVRLFETPNCYADYPGVPNVHATE